MALLDNDGTPSEYYEEEAQYLLLINQEGVYQDWVPAGCQEEADTYLLDEEAPASGGFTVEALVLPTMEIWLDESVPIAHKTDQGTVLKTLYTNDKDDYYVVDDQDRVFWTSNYQEAVDKLMS